MGALVSALAFPHPPKDLSVHALRARKKQLLFLTTDGGLRIPAVHIKRRWAPFTVIYCHGNAEDVGLSLNYLDQMSEVCGCSIFASEYPGYSIAEGEPSEEGCYESINAAYKHLTTDAGVSPEHIVIFGRSLGTGPSVDLCARTPGLAGCILQSPLESGIRCAIGKVSSYTLYPFDIFRSYQKVEKIDCPVLIMHGKEDEVVPCDNGRALYSTLQSRPCHEKVSYSPVWIPNVGHNDMPEEECLGHCRKFLSFLKGRSKN